MELRQALAVGLLDLGYVLHDLERDVEETAISAAEELALDLRLHLFLRAGDGLPGVAIGFLPLWICGNLGAEVGFLGLFFSQYLRV